MSQLSSTHLLYELQNTNSDSDHLDHELNELARELMRINEKNYIFQCENVIWEKEYFNFLNNI